ncbi:LPXTG cell wall anchor domain-containing protein [Streptomyces sp. SID4919]|uniref:lytic polysaccharide monooxygenase auxiliary activity family 9 protein n=1 Tax=unclassified Streptomyces TaxID=2593676 RepID=UPI0008237D7F|nr:MULTISPECIES: lytic polysaccharide monooxygenase [unclassified Streptomyces]MYY11387.1 LPXTG cell wall anchor domain-containing protein [Streptomyces sp. SID4919]SCK57541.1 chitin-binding protein [Streptomyces sp. AmelKG-E11A]
MTARRTVAAIAALGVAPLALTVLTASPAAAHGSMSDPVSRVSACFAEGPESPDSAACKALVATSGTQPLYDWNEVNIANAAGAHRDIIPDGKLCSANRSKYAGLDAPRADWPSSQLKSGQHTFQYRVTAPHKGSIELYITKVGYDPTKALKWSDLESQPFAKVTNPRLANGSFIFDGTVPQRTGRHLVYSVYQRSDSPEAFYTCSDVVFGNAGGGAAAPVASAPSNKLIEKERDNSTVEHDGHGDLSSTIKDGPQNASATDGPGSVTAVENGGAQGTAVKADAGAKAQGGTTENLAETGGTSTTPYIAVGGAAVLALGAAGLFASARRRAATGGGRSGR